MPRELKGWVRSRPLRIAFLIEDGEHATLALDGIFADSYYRWAGRFSLIARCENGKIAPSYWPWLKAYDPDIIYSYVPLSSADVLEIHERLAPAQYLLHDLGKDPRLDVFGFKPSYDFSPLCSLSGLFRLARYSPATGERGPVKIIDSWHTESPSRFLTDNFGTYHTSQGGSIFPPDASAAATLLTIVSPEKQSGPYGVPKDLDAIPDEITAFKEFALRRATSLSIISALFTQRLDIQFHPWSGSFNLVVGNSFADRLLFWNARLLIPSWLDASLCCFRVEFEQLQDPAFLAILGQLLNRHNHVNPGSGGQAQLTLRSASLEPAELAEAQRFVQSTEFWGISSTQRIASLDDIVPTKEALQRAWELNRFRGEQLPQPNWTRFTWSAPTARPPASVPEHLSDAPVQQAFCNGYWCAELIFEYDGLGGRFADVNRWMLPRRWRMANAFKASFVGGAWLALPPPPRRGDDGYLVIAVGAGRQSRQ